MDNVVALTKFHVLGAAITLLIPALFVAFAWFVQRGKSGGGGGG